ncbi:RsmE family RNA methyltransferase [Actinospongicola halichondriae]|uniref:RsmE family RNA methyltransferase n=1 Tax=Actinospongicola halichondriae TaxID=3236844 RepID=UPI003D3D8D2A
MSTRPPAKAAAHVVVADVERPELDDDAAHHLFRVRRLTAGTECTVTDGKGRWRPCRLTADGLDVDGEVVAVERPSPPITIAFALTKSDKPEVVVQKLTELGVDRIVPFRADHSVVRWDDRKAATQRARWQAIARGAVEQSRGVWLPEVDAVTDVVAVAALGASRLDRGGSGPSLARSVLAVGPEGGWSDAERDQLPSVVEIAANVLRAETAALTAGGILCALRSGLVQEWGKTSTERGK